MLSGPGLSSHFWNFYVPDKKHVAVFGDFNENMNKVSECYSVCHFIKTEYQCTQQIEKILQENILE